MEHIIAYNPYKNGNKGSVSSQPLSVYDKTIAYPWMAELVAAIRGGNDELKKQLPFRCAHYYQFRDNRRSQKNAVPESFLFQTTIDVDDKEYVDKAIEKARELNCSDTIWNGALLHLEYSARKKLHIDIRMPIGMTIEETQRAYCEALGVPYDESCITPERMLFITDKESEIYRSPHWYEVLPAEEIKARREAFLKRGLTIDGKKNLPQISQMTQIHSGEVSGAGKSVKSVLSVGPKDDASAGAGNLPQIPQMTQIHSDSASGKNLIAFDLFQESAGLKGMNIDTVGSRHSSLLAIMSAGASRVMSEEELMKVVAKRMPSYYQENDCHQLIHDFYAKYGDSSKPFSRDVIRVNALAEQAAKSLLAGDCKSPGRLAGDFMGQMAGNANHTVQSSNLKVQSEDEDYPAPPPMPKKLPKLVELLISKTPEIYQPAVACAIFPPLATHLWRTKFRYIDNVEHEATLMTCLLAGTGAGKSCVQKPIDFIMEDIRKRDAENLKREKEWKEEMMRKGANKDKRKRPENLIIQEIDADMTNPAFVMRTAEAKEHFLYTSLNEIDQFDALRGIGNQQFRIMCLAFDPSNKFGQSRVGIQSVTERVCVRFNWNASTTIDKGQRYFAKVLTDGPLSRINFCTIPEREIGEDIPVYGTYDDEFRNSLKPYIENLCMASGLVECQEAYDLAVVLKNENAEFARTSQNRIFENFSFRANVIAYLKACVLYVANGYRWEPEMDDFIRWSERYDLYCKMRFFGDMIARENSAGEKSSKRGPENLLQLLPDIFTMPQLDAIRMEHGLNAKGTRNVIKQWIYRGYIERISPSGEDGKSGYGYSSYSFKKLKYRHDGLVLEA